MLPKCSAWSQYTRRRLLHPKTDVPCSRPLTTSPGGARWSEQGATARGDTISQRYAWMSCHWRVEPRSATSAAKPLKRTRSCYFTCCWGQVGQGSRAALKPTTPSRPTQTERIEEYVSNYVAPLSRSKCRGRGLPLSGSYALRREGQDITFDPAPWRGDQITPRNLASVALFPQRVRAGKCRPYHPSPGRTGSDHRHRESSAAQPRVARFREILFLTSCRSDRF